MTSTSLTAEQRRIRARIGAYALHAQGGTSTSAGTQAFLSRFVREVEQAAAKRGESLTPEEVQRRAAMGRRAYFARLALASSRARSKKPVLVSETTEDGHEEGTHDANPTAA